MVKIIGVSGVSGSGKTTLVQSLGKKLNATTLHWDDFDPISQGPDDYVEWFKHSKDCNDWKYDALANVLQSLKLGKKLLCPATKRELIPTNYVIYDAPLGYAHQATGQFIDFLIFLDTPPDIALARRLIRDHQPPANRNKNEMLEEIREYLASSRPVYLHSYAKKYASDLLLDGSLPIAILLEKALNVLNGKNVDWFE